MDFSDLTFGGSNVQVRPFGTAYDTDMESHTTYINNCSPSTVAMMDTESMVFVNLRFLFCGKITLVLNCCFLPLLFSCLGVMFLHI